MCQIVTKMYKYNNTNISYHRQELREKILRTADCMFKREGIRSVRMDDIATRLSISKRTLYELYKNKEDLLLECVKMDKDDFAKRMQDYAMTAENEIDIVVTFFRYKLADFDNINPQFFDDINKYSKVKDFLRQHHASQQASSYSFLRRCVERGFFAPGINFNIIQDISDNFVESKIAESLSRKYTLRDIFLNFFVVLLRGFCTEKGLILLDRYIKKSKL